jgi:hypothetical protein
MRVCRAALIFLVPPREVTLEMDDSWTCLQLNVRTRKL